MDKWTWISVKDRLPDPNDNRPVLVTIEVGGTRWVSSAYYFEMDFFGSVWICSSYHGEKLKSLSYKGWEEDAIEGVVAWMPGPYPYDGN